jgi:hypothetical protein
MTIRSKQLGILIASALLLISGVACRKKATKGVLIFANGFLTPASLKVNDDGSPSNPGDPGWIVLFKTTGRMPAGPDGLPEGTEGQAGSAYRIDEHKQLVKIGEFDTKKSNDELAKEFQ